MPRRRTSETIGQSRLRSEIKRLGGEGYIVAVKVTRLESAAMVMPFEDDPRVFRANYEAVDYAQHGYPKGLGPSAKIMVWRITEQPDGRLVRDTVWRSWEAEKGARDRVRRKSARRRLRTRRRR